MAFSRTKKDTASEISGSKVEASTETTTGVVLANDEATAGLESAKHEDDDSSIIVTEDEAPIVVQDAPTEVYVVPKFTVNCRIGPGHYSFQQGVRTLVPSEIIDHLKRVELI